MIHWVLTHFWAAMWLIALAHWVILCYRMRVSTHRRWWTPSGMAASIAFQIASRMPSNNDAGMVLGAIYGVIETCGISRTIRPVLNYLLSNIRNRLKQ